jgi:hypothetical protein
LIHGAAFWLGVADFKKAKVRINNLNHNKQLKSILKDLSLQRRRLDVAKILCKFNIPSPPALPNNRPWLIRRRIFFAATFGSVAIYSFLLPNSLPI